jgi:hypothetical protein
MSDTFDSTAARLKSFVLGLPRGYIFSSRELLVYAERSSVDAFTSRQVKKQFLERLTRGLFRVNKPDNPPVSVRQIAALKLRAFGKRICTIAQELNPKGAEDTIIFGTNGRTSSVIFQGKRIVFKTVSPRQFSLGETAAGRILRDVWLYKRQSQNSIRSDLWSPQVSFDELKVLPFLRPTLPLWLSSLCRYTSMAS